MSDARLTVSTWISFGASLLALAATSACASRRAPPRQTQIMEKSGAVRVTASELRIRVNDLADRMSGRIEVAADRIRAATKDRTVRRRALAFKVDAIPAVYTAAYRTDPLIAAMDVWALSFQLTQYVEEGAGRDAFGPQQALARSGVSDALGDADAVMRRIAKTPEAFDRGRARLAAWAKEHPVEHTFASRSSAAAFWADMQFEDRDAFAAVGAVSETVEAVAERLNTWAAIMPRQARWQAELLLSDAAGEHDVEGALDDIHGVGETARRLNDLMGEVSSPTEAGASVRDAVAAERRAFLEGINQQRVQTLDYATAERLAVVTAMREERVAVLEALRQERIESLKEIDAIKTRAVDTALAGLRDLVDYTLPRVTVVLLFLMVSAAALWVIAYRLTVGRRSGVSGSA